MNEETRQALEGLKRSVLLVLYQQWREKTEERRCLKIAEIYQRLGIKRLTPKDDDTKHDHLIHGILVRLRKEGCALHAQDAGADDAKKKGEWQITAKGIAVIQGSV